MLFIGYKKCSTSNRAQQWLDEKNVKYDFRDIKENNPTYEELEKWYRISGQPIKKMFNTSGLMYKELGLKDKLLTMSEEEQLQLLSTNGMLVKRPVLVKDDVVLFGFKQQQWEKEIG